jgi:hypothetical protein
MHVTPKSLPPERPSRAPETIVPMLLKEGVEMTVRQSPTMTEATAQPRSPRLICLAEDVERTTKLHEAANDNTDPPLPPASAARWPRVFPGL